MHYFLKEGFVMAAAKMFSVRNMVFTALFSAVLAAVAPFSVNVGPVPLTFATLIIYITAGALGWKQGVLAVFVYLLLGAVGIPVFSGFRGGFQVIAGVTGGYIIGYFPLALATGIAADYFGKKAIMLILAMVIGTVLLYTVGTAWFMIVTGNSLAASLAVCVIPFLPGDAAKIIAASVISPKLRKAIHKTGNI